MADFREEEKVVETVDNVDIFNDPDIEWVDLDSTDLNEIEKPGKGTLIGLAVAGVGVAVAGGVAIKKFVAPKLKVVASDIKACGELIKERKAERKAIAIEEKAKSGEEKIDELEKVKGEIVDDAKSIK